MVDTTTDSEHYRTGDALARRLRAALDSRLAVLSVFLGERQLFVGTDGLPEDLQDVREIPVIAGFCKYVLDSGVQLIVDDVRVETGIATHPLVDQLGVEAYAGWHITGPEGRPIGVLAVMEDGPRAWTSAELLVLMELAHECEPLVRAVVAAHERHGSAA